jgi:hypothetical protein
MNNNFDLKKFLAEGRLLKEDTQNGGNLVSQLINSIPNEKYFYLADEEANFFFNPEENGPDYNWAGFDEFSDGDLVDYFYDDIFNNELKGKPGVEGNNFNEWQDSESEKNNQSVGPNVTLLVNKIKSIISDYKKLKFSDEIPLTPDVKTYIDSTIQSAKEDGELEYLVDVGFFDTDIIDNILVEFIDEFPNADDVNQEVKDYIDSQL